MLRLALLLAPLLPCVFAEVVAPILFSVTLEDGQRISGTLPNQLTIQSRLGEFVLPTERVDHIVRVADHLEFHLVNGDEIHGSVTSTFQLQATHGPTIDLSTEKVMQVQRGGPGHRTGWGETVAGLRARMRLVDAPIGRAGEMILAIELQNTTGEIMRLSRPRFQPRVLHPRDLGQQHGYTAWITGVQEEENVDRDRRLEKMMETGESVSILAGGTYRLQVTIPYQSNHLREAVQQLEKLQDLLLAEEAPARLVTHFYGTDILYARPGEIRFRGYYRSPPEQQKGWQGSLVTPVLTVEIPLR